jgi:GT2 family glycosyltransferase
MTVRVAVIVASHNRATQTLSALRAVHRQDGADARTDVVLCDDGSTDGTVEQVRTDFPSAIVLEEGPELFWNSGMRRAFSVAVEADYDFYLWLNDDTLLDPDAFAILLRTLDDPAVRAHHPAIIVGATRDPHSGELTYGGVIRSSRLRPMRFSTVPITDAPVQAEAMNGNCVLVPREVVRRIGVLDAGYTHAMGDFDYGLRARKAGASVWVAPGTIGTCARNPEPAPAASLRGHLTGMASTKGLPPREWYRFARRWAGPLWPLYAVSPFVRRTGAWCRARVQYR